MPRSSIAVLVIALLPAGGARAQASPNPPDLTILAPAAPGGGWDQTARAMQHVMRNAGIARSVQVVNAAGAAGTIGLARFVSSERGNAHALLVTGLVMVSGIAANRSPVTLADVTPIALLSGEYEVIVVPAASPFRTLDDLIAAFRANPRAISWGGGSAGGTDDILVRLLADRAGVPRSGVNYIAYSGGGQALAAVLGAHVSAAVSGLGEFGAQIEAGQLRALAISAPARLEGVDIPTFHEHDVDLTLLNWRAVVAPPGLSREERRELTGLVERMARSEVWQATLRRNGWADIFLAGAAFERFVAEETARIAPLVAGGGGGGGGTDYFGGGVLLGLAISFVAALLAFLRHRDEAAPQSSNRAGLATLVFALAVNVVLFSAAGFVVASATLFIIAARAFGSRRVLRDTLVGVGLALVIFIAFTRGLGVALPAGPFG